jgi:C1A family cysteine protease
LGSANRKPTVDEIKAAVIKYGIAFVTVAAGGNGWSGRTGEITGCRNTGTNHIVNIIGWTKNGKWKMKNSWGKSWANQGYSLIKFGCDKIAEEAGIVIVE